MLAFRDDDQTKESLEELTESGTPLVSKFAHPYGLNYVAVESVALVTGLDGTGEDPSPTPRRAELLDEMSRRQVEKPGRVLASPDTSLVIVRGYIPPGVKKGDHFDVEVRVPNRGTTSSLRGGWVMPSRMKRRVALGRSVRKGHLLATAEGAVLVDPQAEGEEDAAIATRGRILGGGTALKSRDLGLVVGQEHRSIRMSQAIAKAINGRFHIYDGGRKVGVATPKDDEFIEIKLHPRYKDNITRYVRVARSVAVEETPSQVQQRINLLATQLLDPLTTSNAAIRLEAIGGDQAVQALRAGLDSGDAEVRFYAAEALAYLDETDGAEALAEAARDEPAFRVHALAALSAMDDVLAYDELRTLLSSESAETRYGAFRSLWAMNDDDPLIRGERLGGQFNFHVLDVAGPPMVHATRSARPELVLFGADQRFEMPMVLDAGSDILVNGLTDDEVTISRFSAGEAPKKRVVPADVEQVVRTIVELGGTYPDVVQALQQAKRDGALASRFRVDAIPRAGRQYDRDEDDDEPTDGAHDAETDGYRVSTPLPDLFSRKK